MLLNQGKRHFRKQVLPRSVEVTRLSYFKLLNDKDSVMEAIEKAYSENGLGTLAIEGVPDYSEKRRKALL